MSIASLRKGWCPGVLRPMASGDGLIVRLKPSGGALSAAAASRIASMALRYGSGAIDVTQRANLQLRGIRETAIAPLTDELNALDLIDATPEAEAVRNVVLSPLAGIDPACKDGTAIAHALETELGQDATLHALPAKFGFVIDGGGVWPLGACGADVTAFAGDAASDWRIKIAGSEAASAPIPWHAVAEAMLALAHGFNDKGLPAGFVRMRQLVAAIGVDAMFRAAGLVKELPVNEPTVTRCIGHTALTPSIHIAAVGLPFGRISASDLQQLCEAAPKANLRLTPWRTLTFVCATETEAMRVLAIAASLALVTSQNDARLAIDACIGAPGCGHGTTRTRADAELIAAVLGARAMTPGSIHVSGCAKGCAHRGCAPVTFVGRDGHYDLILSGVPTDQPTRTGLAPADLAAAAVDALGAKP